jgi:carbon-monoxide dehydrogenase large subunit
VDAAFAGAAHVTRLRIVSQRLVVNPMEPRAALGEFDPATGRFTLHVGSQGAFGMRAAMAASMNEPVEKSGS